MFNRQDRRNPIIDFLVSEGWSSEDCRNLGLAQKEVIPSASRRAMTNRHGF